MTYSETLNWLFNQLPMYQLQGASAYKKDLTNVHVLMDYLGHPESQLQCIHVAGTNGKGSCSHMLASVLQEAGFKVGLYTSPHLKDFRERIKINGQMVSEAFVCDFVNQHQSFFEANDMSFFEMSVGLAFDYFTKELNVSIFHHPQRFKVGDDWFYVGHGDGLGPNDYTYKLLKILFRSPICQWLFARIHPNFGIGIADAWSKRSRITNSIKDDVFLGEEEWLLVYAKAMQLKQNNQFYIFGHRHLPMEIQLTKKSKYINNR